MKLSILRTFEWSLLIVSIILVVIGIVTIYSITYADANLRHLTYDQIIFDVIGLGLMIFLCFLDYRFLRGLAWLLYFLGLILLIAVWFWGKKIYGAVRWLDFGLFQLQPSELFKLFAIILLSKFFSEWQELNFKKIVWLVILFIPPFFLIFKEPDFGTAIVIFVVVLIYLWYSPLKRWYLGALGGTLAVLTPAIWHFLHDYQKIRILSFINPAFDPTGAGYNVRQALIAIGSGGLFGRGLGWGSQSQLKFLPVAWTDFIFAVWAEGAGFIGSIILLGLLIFLVWRAVKIAWVSKDTFGMYLALGIAAMIFAHITINVGMNLRLLPATGVPLPLVSYGGTSLVVMLSSVGILESIYLRHKKITF